MFKEKLNLSTKLLMCAISLAIVFAFSNNASAQDFNNLGSGTYTVGAVQDAANKQTLKKNRGIIRMRGSSTSNGHITGLGDSDATRIQGTVIWARKDSTQKPDNKWYTSLGVQETGDKVFEANKHYRVSHEFLRYANSLKAYPLNDGQAQAFYTSGTVPVGMPLTALPSIIHECKSSFWYDGILDQYVLGSLYSSSGGVDNVYSILNGSNPNDITFLFYTQTGAWIRDLALGGNTHIAATGSLNIRESLVACALDTTSIDDSIIIDTCDAAWIAANPDYVCRTDTNTCVDCDPCEESPALSLGGNIVITIDGTMIWEGLPDSDEMIPICMDPGSDGCATTPDLTREPSKVIYTVNATKVFPAHYGIIEFEAGAHNIPLNGDVFIKGQRPYALNFLGTGVVTTDKYKMTFTDACADATYASCGEVVGWIYRTESTAAHTYTYHNASTKVALNPAPSSAGSESFGLLSVPGDSLVPHTLYNSKWNTPTSPISSYATDPPTGTGYVNRLWQVDFAGTGVISYIELGFKYSEIDAALLSAWESMRTYEGYSGNPELQLLVGDGAKAWNFGTLPTDVACLFYSGKQINEIDLSSDAAPGTPGYEATDLADNSQILFGNVPTTVKSVMDGRWSNPATWGGVTPTRFDSVYIRHQVYTGLFDGLGQILGSDQWSTNEYDLPMVKTPADNFQLAKSVNIAVQSEVVTVNPTGYAALIIGNHDIASSVFVSDNEPKVGDWNYANRGTAMDLNIPLLFGTIYNNNATLPGAGNTGISLPTASTGTPLKSSKPVLGGLYIMGNDTEVPVATVIKSLENNGATTNEGIIEFGHPTEE